MAGTPKLGADGKPVFLSRKGTGGNNIINLSVGATAGTAVPGAQLSNGSETIQIRT